MHKSDDRGLISIGMLSILKSQTSQTLGIPSPRRKSGMQSTKCLVTKRPAPTASRVYSSRSVGISLKGTS
jgi:hypothetical protein